MARILIIDDNENIRETLSEILVLQNYEVLSAGDGKEAMEMLGRLPVDLIITDLLMPEKGGIDTIKEVRRQYPAVKIFAMSGGWIGRKELLLKSAEEAGAIRTFAKPVKWEELKNAVEEALGK